MDESIELGSLLRLGSDQVADPTAAVRPSWHRVVRWIEPRCEVERERALHAGHRDLGVESDDGCVHGRAFLVVGCSAVPGWITSGSGPTTSRLAA